MGDRYLGEGLTTYVLTYVHTLDYVIVGYPWLYLTMYILYITTYTLHIGGSSGRFN